MSIKNPRKTRELRKELRSNMTEAEALLWERLRKKQLCGVRVKRQYGFGPYVVDFYIPKVFLVIEVDGKIHLKKEVREKDINKDTFFHRSGIDVIRIKNEEIFDNMDAVISRLNGIVERKLEELKSKD